MSKPSVQLINQLFSLIDLTRLDQADEMAVIDALCAKAFLGASHVAAICVYPAFVSHVAEVMRGRGVKVATVANFPSGDELLDNVLASIHLALQQGADEIDVVFPYQRFLAGDYDYAYAFVRACKVASGQHVLKVILETGAYSADLAAVARASECAIKAGADFLKTSTGKIAVGATLPVVRVMLNAIKSSAPDTVGLKISGGVRTLEQALSYVRLINDVMGARWVVPAHVRIGASQLVDEIIQFYSVI